MQHPSSNFATGAACPADSNVKALEVDRLLTEFMNLLFSEGHRAWKGEKTLNQHPLLLLLSNFFAAGGKSTGSKLPSPQRMEKGVSEFFETTAPGSSLERFWPWTCAGSVVRWRLCSPQVKCCHSNPRVSWHRRRWSPKLGDIVVPQARTGNSKTGDADDTISLDSKRCLWMGASV